MIRVRLLTLVVVGVMVFSCRVGLSPRHREPYLRTLPLGPGILLPVPSHNQLTAAKAEFGRKLFFERQLSRDGSLACASCHLPEKAFTDGRTVSTGIDGSLGRRNTPSLLNRAYSRSLFWDGRAASLEEQALQPMINPAELGNTHEEIVRRLRKETSYRRLFQAAYGDEEINVKRVAEAIASFERTLLSGNSAFDRYELLKDEAALSESAKRGLELFRGKANCSVCHESPLFTDERFHNTGVSWGKLPADIGRYEITGRHDDKGKFKTPSLRDVEQTAPYMHDGSLKTLEQVIEFYNRGAGPNPYLDGLIKPLQLTAQEKIDLLSFLKTLTGEYRQASR